MIRIIRTGTLRQLEADKFQLEEELYERGLIVGQLHTQNGNLMVSVDRGADQINRLLSEISGRDDVIRDQENSLEAQARMLSTLQTAYDRKSDQIVELERRINACYERLDYNAQQAEVERRRGFLGRLFGRFS